jgi:hypothetical protein
MNIKTRFGFETEVSESQVTSEQHYHLDDHLTIEDKKRYEPKVIQRLKSKVKNAHISYIYT